MRITLLATLLFSLLANTAHAGEKSEPLTQWQLNEIAKRKVDSWFYYAASAKDQVFVTDAKGCLFSVHDNGDGINVVPVLDRVSRQHCRLPKQKIANQK